MGERKCGTIAGPAWRLAVWGLALHWGVHGAAFAADYTIDDEYLQSLSAEADQLEYMSGAEAEVKASQREERAAPSTHTLGLLQQALTGRSGFERVLSQEFPYSYQLYRRLQPGDRRKAYEALQRTRRFSAVKRRIIDLYKRRMAGH